MNRFVLKLHLVLFRSRRIESALHHPDAGVRYTAVTRIRDPSVLESVARNDLDASVRRIVAERLSRYGSMTLRVEECDGCKGSGYVGGGVCEACAGYGWYDYGPKGGSCGVCGGCGRADTDQCPACGGCGYTFMPATTLSDVSTRD